jgi:hypothetical protein
MQHAPQTSLTNIARLSRPVGTPWFWSFIGYTWRQKKITIQLDYKGGGWYGFHLRVGGLLTRSGHQRLKRIEEICNEYKDLNYVHEKAHLTTT